MQQVSEGVQSDTFEVGHRRDVLSQPLLDHQPRHEAGRGQVRCFRAVKAGQQLVHQLPDEGMAFLGAEDSIVDSRLESRRVLPSKKAAVAPDSVETLKQFDVGIEVDPSSLMHRKQSHVVGRVGPVLEL